MMRSKPFLKNLVKTGLRSLLFTFIILFSGCSSSTTPSFPKENIPQAIVDISKSEYKLDVISKLIGRTLWVYLPLENIIKPQASPEKYTEKFSLEQNNGEFSDRSFRVSYLIKPIPDKISQQEMGIDKKVSEKIFSLLQVIRRVLFSTDHSKNNTPTFFYIVIADIKNGFEIKDVFNYSDLQKISYGLISQTEYQHRIIQDTSVSLDIIGDTQGKHLAFKDISMEEFIISQIQHRIKLKFQKPEVQKNADIDKEVLKIISHTLKTYEYKNFTSVELYNMLKSHKTILNQAAIFTNPTD